VAAGTSPVPNRARVLPADAPRLCFVSIPLLISSGCMYSLMPLLVRAVRFDPFSMDPFSTAWRSTCGVLGAYLPNCSKGGRCSRGGTVSSPTCSSSRIAVSDPLSPFLSRCRSSPNRCTPTYSHHRAPGHASRRRYSHDQQRKR